MNLKKEMTILPTRAQIKAQAKALHQELKKGNSDIKLSHVYNQLARQYGFKDWNVFSAILNKGQVSD